MITSNISGSSSMSRVMSKVELYNGSTLFQTCTCNDVLQDFTITREGDTSKFFGFGVCQKMSINLIDLYRELSLSTSNTIEIALGNGTTFDYPYPTFYISEISRDEDNNTITATAYDAINKASKHTILDLNITAPYTIRELAESVASFLGLTIYLENVPSGDTAFNTSYAQGGNFDGTETLREVLNYIAEVTQTIYFVNYENKLVFKRLAVSADPVHTISKDSYFVMHTMTNRKLIGICRATELGDNVHKSLEEDGIIQFVRNNPLWDLREDIGTLLDNAVAAIGGLTINQFDCDWIGNYLLEIGDKIALETENNSTVTSYVLSDTVKYDGVLNEVTDWEYTENVGETASNPTSIGDKINQTFARVDKVNREIALVVNQVSENSSKISQIEIDLDSIDLSVEEKVIEVVDEKLAELDTSAISDLSGQVQTNTTNIGSLQITSTNIAASVKTVEETTQKSINNVNESIETLSKEVNLKVTSEDVSIIVEQELAEGVENVKTASKKYTFNDEGLNITSSENEISTKITEDGMRVYKNNQEVLTADNTGVKAQDLHAVTYLIIGDTSRLEDRLYRTACFWIGDD